MSNKTLYSKAVAFKKSIFAEPLIPPGIAIHIDTFFNTFHNVLLYTMVKSRDLTRDTLIQSFDITRDTLIKSKDVTRDSLVQSLDVTRDVLVKTKDVTRDTIIKSKDVTRDSLVRSKDMTRDTLIRSKDMTKDIATDSLKLAQNSIEIGKNAEKSNSVFKKAFFFLTYFSVNVVYVFRQSLRLRKYAISQEGDQAAVAELGILVVNSDTVKDRVRRFYDREVVVIHPPIDTEVFSSDKGYGEYWLSVNRITPEKRIELQMEAFACMPSEKLIIVGGCDDVHYSYADSLIKKCSENVTFRGQIDNETLLSLYASCKGFITTSKDEDFGMSVVEAMASGKPVIAPNEGGYRETIIQGKTGTLIEDITADKLVEAIREVGKDPASYKEACLAQAKRFDVSVFVEKVKSLI